MSKVILIKEMKESQGRSVLVLEWKTVWREAQHTSLLLEPSSLGESIGCLYEVTSAPFLQSVCQRVAVSGVLEVRRAQVERFPLFFMKHHQRIGVTELFVWK